MTLNEIRDTVEHVQDDLTVLRSYCWTLSFLEYIDDGVRGEAIGKIFYDLCERADAANAKLEKVTDSFYTKK